MAESRSKRNVEIISGRDRRLQGEGEETGPRLQRDRSGVSEMEPLPAAQDALRLELRSAEAWNYATLRLCHRSCRDSRPRTTVDPRVPPCRRHRRHLRSRRPCVVGVVVFIRVFGPKRCRDAVDFGKRKPFRGSARPARRSRQTAMSIVFYRRYR